MNAKKGEIFRRVARGLLLAWGIVMLAMPPAAWGQTIQWTRQVGVGVAFGISVDASGVYVTGITFGTLPGQISAGGADAFVRKYDAAGNEVWTRQFGSSSHDEALAISVDASGVYVAGGTFGTLPGQTSAGFVDAFVRKYDLDGNEVWTRQFGTSGGDDAFGISVDASGVYVAGFTEGTLPGQSNAGGLRDAFVRKYDADGNEVWTRQFGTSNFGGGVLWTFISVDASGVYVAGVVVESLPGQTSAGRADAFVRRYDLNGNEVWTRQFGTPSQDEALAISVDASGVYVAGETHGTLPGQTSAGFVDAFVRKYDLDGNEVWTRQFGTSSIALTRGISVDASGVYVAGQTSGALPGQCSASSADAFVRKYDADGNEVWTRQFGTSGGQAAAFGISVDASGVFAAGFTQLPTGAFAFVVKLTTQTLPEANQAPVANAGPDKTLIVSELGAFDGSGSSDPDGTVVSYAWNFGDGGTGSGVTATHAFSAAGTFTVTLTVTDNVGATGCGGTVTTVITVAQAIGQLGSLVVSFNLQQGISNSLDTKVQNVLEAFQAANAQQRQDAANKLQAFIDAVEAQRGKELTNEQADTLIALARRILAVL